MSQRKHAVGYLSESHAVYEAVRRHFNVGLTKLPPEWEAIVALVCFPKEASEQQFFSGYESKRNRAGEWVLNRDPKTKQFVKAFTKVTILADEFRAFERFLKRDPVLAFKVFYYAADCLRRLRTPLKDADKVRHFLLVNGSFIRDNGEWRPTRPDDRRSTRRRKIVGAASTDIADKELAAMIFGHEYDIKKVQTVKRVRQDMSYRSEKIELSPSALVKLRRQIRKELKAAGLSDELLEVSMQNAQTCTLRPAWPGAHGV